MKMIRTELGGIVVFVPDWTDLATREAVEREVANAELAQASSSNLRYASWRQAQSEIPAQAGETRAPGIHSGKLSNDERIIVK